MDFASSNKINLYKTILILMENDIYLLAEEESDDLSMLEGIESTKFYSLSQSHKLCKSTVNFEL